MREIRVYTNQPLSSGGEITLETQASRHLATVLRLKPGTPVTLFNGQGGEYSASLVSCGKQVRAAVHDFVDSERESPLNIYLGIGLSRGDRMDMVIQKATELGVTAITPLYTERTEVKLKGDRAEKKLRHWQQVVASACEQCHRNRLPEISAPVSLSEWIEQIEVEEKLVLHHRSEQTLSQLQEQQPASVALLIGPEGGLSEQEINLAEKEGFSGLKLGPRVLRTETAPLTAISVLQTLWGDF